MGKRRIIKVSGRDGSEIARRSFSKTLIRKRKNISRCQIHIKSTYNNTIVTLTDLNGGVIAWSSAGLLGFKGAKKATPYAATNIVNSLLEKTKRIGIREVDIYVKGIGSGRESAIRSIVANGLNIVSITDMTPVPHNGCKPPKPRRV